MRDVVGLGTANPYCEGDSEQCDSPYSGNQPLRWDDRLLPVPVTIFLAVGTENSETSDPMGPET